MFSISLSYGRQTETETERPREGQTETKTHTEGDTGRQTETETETERETAQIRDKNRERQTDRQREIDRRHHGGPQPFVPHRRLLHLRHYPRPLHHHRHLLLFVWWSTKDNGRVSARGPCYEVHSLGYLAPCLLRFLHIYTGFTCRDVRVRGADVVEFFRLLCSYNVRLSGHGTSSVSSQNNQRL